jgi:tetratricopeptide (TPR) repeat protein
MIRNYILFLLLALSQSVYAQKSSITIEKRDILTYPYNDPDPVPGIAVGKDAIYPYHSFNGYSVKATPVKWDVVRLDNDYVTVWVLPSAGGKVWGAIEKSTGKEFIYRNEVMKFRNISMRGPWTSGGIEFNFGIIGHSPSTCVPVDYKTVENSDGSVSCIVGNIDLPSRTRWNVEIRLPADKAYFETIATWVNTGSLPQTYYNWMTAAAVVTNDLEFEYPGNAEIGHAGEYGLWPVNEEGRNVSWYKNNNFGSSKSYHVVGEYNDFMGGYYHNSQFGFGHWALYDEMPGHKLWLWSLARDGGIWEDLLTDSDGQYMEFQAGRMFNQYGGTSAFKTPISQTPFEPDQTDRWHEIWFPVKEIGGISDVSTYGAMHVAEENGKLQIGINSFAFTEGRIMVLSDDVTLSDEQKNFSPMEVYNTVVDLRARRDYQVIVQGMDLDYNPSKKKIINRPFVSSMPTGITTASSLFQEGMELIESRKYAEAAVPLKKCIESDPLYVDAYVALAELRYRAVDYDSALFYTEKALQLDTYHPGANYIAGITYLAIGDMTNALESLGWAARSNDYRSAAYEKMAVAEFRLNDYKLAEHYALLSLDYNRYNFNSLRLIAVLKRYSGDDKIAEDYLSKMDEIDKLNHFTSFERCFLYPSSNRKALSEGISNELPFETYLEISLQYLDMGLKKEALLVLDSSPSHPIITIWKAFLADDDSLLNEASVMSPAFVFPFRPETVKALEWAKDHNSDWKFRYYLALNYTAVNRRQDAVLLFEECGNEPDYAPFYLTRASYMKGTEREKADLLTAFRLSPGDWRSSIRLIAWYRSHDDHRSALSIASEAYRKDRSNSIVGLEYAISLINTGQYALSLRTLEGMTILPNEGSSQGKKVFEQASLFLAMDLITEKKYKQALGMIEKSKEWPENLGVGKPYNVDTRIQDYLSALCLDKMKRYTEADSAYNSVIRSTGSDPYPSFKNILALVILRRKGESNNSEELAGKLEGSSNPVNNWVIAHFRNERDQEEQLEKKFDSETDFRIIKRLLEVTDR